MSKTILAYGELLWDILPDQTMLGGAPFNFAYRVNSLGDQSLFVSRIGRDSLGKIAIARVEKLGLDTSLIQIDKEYPTGTVDVSFDDDNMPDYVIVPDTAYDRIQFSDRLLSFSRHADCICFGTLIQRSHASRATLKTILDHSPKVIKFLDINLRKDCFSKESIIYSLEQADILKLNDDEVGQICTLFDIKFNSYRTFCQYAVETWKLKYILITFGQYGACAYSKDGSFVYTPGYQIETVDSLGAGDAFSAGFLFQILRQASLEQSCEFGNTLGALVATTKGATTPIHKSVIDKFKTNKSERLFHPEFC